MQHGIKQHRLTSGQKTGFVLLLIFACATIALGLLQMRNTIYGPFVRRVADNQNVVQFDELARLQQIDTDQDGLSDFEEIYFYGTSPYLPDTDSDGILDKVEIDQGTDPLCPEGKVCAETGTALPAVSSTSPVSPLADVSTPADVIFNSQLSNDQIPSATSSITSFEQLLSNPEQVRQLLVSTGQIDAAQLEQIDDAALMTLVQDIFAQQQQSANSVDSQPTQ